MLAAHSEEEQRYHQQQLSATAKHAPMPSSTLKYQQQVAYIQQDQQQQQQPSTPVRTNRTTVVYASSSTQRRSFDARNYNGAQHQFSTPSKQAPPIAAMSGYRPSAVLSRDNSRTDRPGSVNGSIDTPVPDRSYSGIMSPDNGSESEFVDDDFKRLVEELDNEEFAHNQQQATTVGGDGRGQANEARVDGGGGTPNHINQAIGAEHFIEQEPVPDFHDQDDDDDDHLEENYQTPVGNGSRNGSMDMDDIEGDHSTEDLPMQYLNAPSLELLDAELDDLEREEQQREHYLHPDEEQYHQQSRFEGLTELELTGIELNQQESRPDFPHTGTAEPGYEQSSRPLSRQERTPGQRPDQLRSQESKQIDEADWFYSPLATPTPANVSLRRGSASDGYHHNPHFPQTRPKSAAAGRISELADYEEPHRPASTHPTAGPPHLRTYSPPLNAYLDGHDANTEEQDDNVFHATDNAMSDTRARVQTSTSSKSSPGQFIHIMGGERGLSPTLDLLEQAQDEVARLRALNDDLLHENEQIRAEKDAIKTDLAVRERELTEDFDRELREMQQKERTEHYELERQLDRNQELENQVAAMRLELERSQVAQTQMASIRSTLQREKELDVLNIKKDLAAQKERQLQELRRELARDKENHSRRLKDEMESQQENLKMEKERLEKDVARLRKLLEQRDEEVQELEQRCNTRMRKPETEDFEQQHNAYADQVKLLEDQVTELHQRYDAQMDLLEHQLLQEREHSDALQKQVSELSADRQPPVSELSLSELEKHCPTQLRQLRASLESNQAAQLSALESSHTAALRAMSDRHSSQLADVMSRAEEEHAQIVMRQREEIRAITVRLKEQCTQAYDLAIARLKEDMAHSEKKIRERFEIEKQRYKREMDMEIEDLKDLLKREKTKRSATPDWTLNESTDSAERLHRRVQELMESNTALKEALAQSTVTHQQALLDAQHRAGRDLSAMLQKMKQKYLETLKTMRDDLARSKRLGMERLEVEWRKRRTALDKEWQAKLDEATRYYESGGTASRRPAAASSSRRHPLPSSPPPARSAPQVPGGASQETEPPTKAVWKPPGAAVQPQLGASLSGARTVKQTRFREGRS